MNSCLELLKWYKDIGCDTFYKNEPGFKGEIIVSNSTNERLEIKKEEKNKKSLDCNFEELVEIIKNFDGCALKKAALNTVVYDGVKDAKIMLVGEAPGATEDKKGIPFCGQSGKLLDNVVASIGLDRSKNVFITNTVFWRPPANRRPTPEEISLCKPFLEKMISLVSPKLIVLVGSTAVESLLDLKESMGILRKKSFLYNNQYLQERIPTEVIFHPSYLLRQPLQKKEMWYDMLKIKIQYLDKEL